MNDFLYLLAQSRPLVAPIADAPTPDAMWIVGVVSRVLHIGSAIILGGGLFYLKTVLAPAGSEALFANRREVWARWVGASSGLLLLTGIYNFVTISASAKAAGNPLAGAYHPLFGVKFLLALGVMAIAAILAGRTSAAERFRLQAGKWLAWASLALTAIVVIGAILRTYH